MQNEVLTGHSSVLFSWWTNVCPTPAVAQALEVIANVSALSGWSRLILKQTVVESDELGEYSEDAMVRMSLPGVEKLTTCKHPQRRRRMVRKAQLMGQGQRGAQGGEYREEKALR